jgi:hypothetical protein
MPSPLELLTYGVLALVAWRLAGAARVAFGPAGRARVLVVVRGIRWRHVWPVPFVLAAVVAVAVGLFVVAPPLQIGWWSLLGGEGNPAFGENEVTSGTAWSWLLPLVFVALLVPALPLFAQREEEIFRLGAEHRSPAQRLGRSVLFGLVHALVGIPVGAAMALSVGGVYFTHCYLRAHRRTGSRAEALLESTRAHTAYNALIVALLLVTLALQALGW